MFVNFATACILLLWSFFVCCCFDFTRRVQWAFMFFFFVHGAIFIVLFALYAKTITSPEGQVCTGKYDAEYKNYSGSPYFQFCLPYSEKFMVTSISQLSFACVNMLAVLAVNCKYKAPEVEDEASYIGLGDTTQE